MIRITQADEPVRTTIVLDGLLSRESVESVQTCCMEALSKGKPVRLHLREVAFIDEFGRTMLRRLAAEGIDLMANGIYSSYVVEEIQSARAAKARSCG